MCKKVKYSIKVWASEGLPHVPTFITPLCTCGFQSHLLIGFNSEFQRISIAMGDFEMNPINTLTLLALNNGVNFISLLLRKS